jgi:hypothetical protein
MRGWVRNGCIDHDDKGGHMGLRKIGKRAAVMWGPRYSVFIPADGRITTVPDYATYDFDRLDIR